MNLILQGTFCAKGLQRRQGGLSGGSGSGGGEWVWVERGG